MCIFFKYRGQILAGGKPQWLPVPKMSHFPCQNGRWKFSCSGVRGPLYRSESLLNKSLSKVSSVPWCTANASKVARVAREATVFWGWVGHTGPLPVNRGNLTKFHNKQGGFWALLWCRYLERKLFLGWIVCSLSARPFYCSSRTPSPHKCVFKVSLK